MDKTQIVPIAGNIFWLRRWWGVKCIGGLVHRMRWNFGSKYKPDWVRHCNRGQANQGKVLDNCCQMTSTLGIFRSKDHVITFLLNIL